MDKFLVPAEHWQRIASANSCHIAVEQKADRPVSVLTAEYRGFLYTAFGTLHGPFGEARKPYVDAYRLLPMSMYTGETTLVYHDEEAVRAGQRERGDHTGLIVSVKGKLMVCAERARFIMDLPGTRPLSLAEAKAYDENQRMSGWRALWYGGKEPEWYSLRCHPVAVYRGHKTLDKDKAVLFWGHNGVMHELGIDDDVLLDGVDQERVPVASNLQLELF